jgi:putative adenylate-forming enzyme
MIHEIYKATEGPIAISCSKGSLHINEDLVRVEVLDRDGTPTPQGRPGHKMIVTDLHKKAQPIIRYELNDMVTISDSPCECGSAFRVIDAIQGRSDDLFWAKRIDTGEWQYIFPDFIRRAIITSSEDIDEYQAVQNSPEDVFVRIQLRKGIKQAEFNEEELISNIRHAFERQTCRKPQVRVLYEKPRLNKNSQKLIRIHRAFELDETMNEGK